MELFVGLLWLYFLVQLFGSVVVVECFDCLLQLQLHCKWCFYVSFRLWIVIVCLKNLYLFQDIKIQLLVLLLQICICIHTHTHVVISTGINSYTYTYNYVPKKSLLIVTSLSYGHLIYVECVTHLLHLFHTFSRHTLSLAHSHMHAHTCSHTHTHNFYTSHVIVGTVEGLPNSFLAIILCHVYYYATCCCSVDISCLLFVYTFYLHFVLTHLLVSKLLLAKHIVPVFCFFGWWFFWSSFPWSNVQY